MWASRRGSDHSIARGGCASAPGGREDVNSEYKREASRSEKGEQRTLSLVGILGFLTSIVAHGEEHLSVRVHVVEQLLSVLV